MQTLDTRNLQERLEELQTAFNEWKDSLSAEQIAEIKEEFQIEEPDDQDFRWKWEDEVGSDADELKNLIELREEFGREWNDGVELIREKDFEEYAQDYAERVGAIDRDGGWPACHIDWEAAANSLMIDYSSVDYDGETYYYRE